MPAATNKPKRFNLIPRLILMPGAWEIGGDKVRKLTEVAMEYKEDEKGMYVLASDCDDIVAENERLRKASEWHSKDTLPKEGIDVLCMSGDYMFVGWVDKYGIWQSSDDSRFVPNCWMPLPQAPANEGGRK